MSEDITCEDVNRIIDRLADGSAADNELASLRAHIAACPDCAMLARIHEHYARISGEELDSRVPDEMVDEMWQDVSSHITERETPGTPGSERPPAGRITPTEPKAAGSIIPCRRDSWWRRGLVPALAAAVIVLVFACGFLVGELRQLRGREGRLIEELAASRQTLDTYRQHAAAARASRAGSIGVGLAAAWRRALPAREEFSIAELISLLEALPAGASILPAGNDLPLFGSAIPLRGVAYRACRGKVDMDDGLQAGEAVVLAKCLALDPGMRIARERLITIIENMYQKGVRS